METRHIVVAGAGGNTGSQLLPHLARMPGITRLTLVDPDTYEPANLAVQNIGRSDLGRPKVLAQARKLRLIRDGLEVVALQERIEDVPLGLLPCDLIASCLDSRAARQHVNEIAARLRLPWIDCGILGSQNLARVNVYASSPEAPCLECLWSREDYALVEQEYLCGAETGAAFPTMASSALGALAASLMAIEITRLLPGGRSAPIAPRQLVLDAGHHTLQVSTSRRNPECLFDHRAWEIEPWDCRPESMTVAAALAVLGSLQVEGHRFVRALVCPGCGFRRDALRLNRPLAHCPDCNRRMAPPGFDSRERLDAGLAGEFGGLTLARVGLRIGDVISSGGRHYQIAQVQPVTAGCAGNSPEAA